LAARNGGDIAVSRDGVRTIQYNEPEELLSALPGVAMRAVPLRAGAFTASVTSFDLGDIVFQTGECSPAIIIAAAGTGTAAVQLPFEGVETFILNGRAAPPRAVGLYGPGGTLERANPRPTRHAVLLLPAAAAEALLSPSSASPLLRPEGQGLLQADPCNWEHAVALSRAAADAAQRNPSAFGAVEVRRSLRASLLNTAQGLIAGPKDGKEPKIIRASSARRRIVTMTDEYLRSEPARPIYTDDLCAVLGISPDRLAEAFHATFGISPHRFLKLRRLAMVRTCLRSRDVPALRVKAVALSHGFWHLGQFAQDYRGLYGESPSDTLARARGAPGH
jgi:AraC family transcriptional regulator, ethanolamine operon transcriptional activator